MDGLSAAASGIAVVSLALQLVGSVRDIRRFLHDMSEASEELKRMMDLLEQLEIILEQVGLLVQRQRGNGRLEETGVMTSVSRAIVTCEKKLTLLEGVVEATQKASANSRVAKTLGSFKLACHKKDIRSFEQQLSEAVNLLSLTMMANLTFVHSEGIKQLHTQVTATNQTTNSISQELILLRNDLANKRETACNKTSLTVRGCSNKQVGSPTPRISRRQLTAFQSYTSIFGKLIIRRASKTSNFNEDGSPTDPETYSSTTSSWTFMPSFLSRNFEYQSFSSFGSIQRAIRIYPVIPDDHTVWTMCKIGDLKGIQKLLSTQQVSLFSVDKYGFTLLHFATVHHRVELCELFFQQGLGGQEVAVTGLRPWIIPRNLGEILKARDMYALFKSRCGDFDQRVFLRYVFMRSDIKVPLKEFNEMVTEFCSKDTINGFDWSPLYTAMNLLHDSGPDSRNGWEKLIHRLLTLGPDLHKSIRSSIGGTLLHEVLSIAQYPFESGELGEQWLRILERSGIDIEEYLRTERFVRGDASLPILLFEHQWQPNRTARTRCAYIIFSESSPRVSWDWYIDPQSHAVEVLNEFKNLGPSSYDIPKGYQYPERMVNWPYFYPRWEVCYGHSFYYVMKEYRMKYFKTPFENRFERRRLKKARKLYKAQGIGKRKRIPGAWID